MASVAQKFKHLKTINMKKTRVLQNNQKNRLILHDISATGVDRKVTLPIRPFRECFSADTFDHDPAELPDVRWLSRHFRSLKLKVAEL